MRTIIIVIKRITSDDHSSEVPSAATVDKALLSMVSRGPLGGDMGGVLSSGSKVQAPCLETPSPSSWLYLHHPDPPVARHLCSI